MRRATLSRPLPVAALVGHYPTNKLIGHGPLPDWQARRSPPLIAEPGDSATSSGISSTFAKGIAPAVIPESEVRYPCITLPFATNRLMQAKNGPYDLHVLAMPPAFVLSQDQTLRLVLLPGPKAVGILTKGSNTHVCIRECSSGSPKGEPTPVSIPIGSTLATPGLMCSKARRRHTLAASVHCSLVRDQPRALPPGAAPHITRIGADCKPPQRISSRTAPSAKSSARQGRAHWPRHL
jgi:hypothetical protein